METENQNFNSLEFFNEPDAAKRLLVSTDTLKRWRIAGQIEFVRIGKRRVIYSKAQIIAFLQSRTNQNPHTTAKAA